MHTFEMVRSCSPRLNAKSVVLSARDFNNVAVVSDTAAQVTTIDPALVTDLHLKLLGSTSVTGAGFSTRASYARLESLQTGDRVIKDTHFEVFRPWKRDCPDITNQDFWPGFANDG